MHVEMARMLAGSTPRSPAPTSFSAVTGSPAHMGSRATASRSSSAELALLPLWM